MKIIVLVSLEWNVPKDDLKYYGEAKNIREAAEFEKQQNRDVEDYIDCAEVASVESITGIEDETE